MTNRQKIKGTTFERQAAELLQSKIKNSTFKRIPGSGAIGTILKEPILMGDIIGKVDGFPKEFAIEAKTGYGGATQFTLKKEWLDKIKEEAELKFRMPALIGKFSGALTGVKVFVVLDVDTFSTLVNMASEKDGGGYG